MKLNTTNLLAPQKGISSGKLDKSQSMQEFLKSQKLIKELCKGVQSLKSYIYPTILQRQALEPLRKVAKNKATAGAPKNIIIRYKELNGIKLTVMLPVLNNQIKDAISMMADSMGTSSDDTAPLLYSTIMCHSHMRCEDMGEFISQLTSFCDEIVKVVLVH